MVKRVAAFNLLINQSRDRCATVEGAGKSISDCRVCKGEIREKNMAPEFSTGHGVGVTELPGSS